MSADDYDIQDEFYNDEDDIDEEDENVNEAKEEKSEEDISAEELVAAAASAHSALAARNKVREAMQADIEAFLARGGKIQQVEEDLLADPPRKPTSNYGSQPI